MHPALIGALIGGGVGLLKQSGDQKAANEERRINAEAMRYSPWTGMQPDKLVTRDPSLLGNVATGALGGASFGLANFGKSTTDSDSTTSTAESVTGTGLTSGANTPQTSAGAAYSFDPTYGGLNPTGEMDLYQRSLMQSHNPWLYMNSRRPEAGAIQPPKLGGY